MEIYRLFRGSGFRPCSHAHYCGAPPGRPRPDLVRRPFGGQSIPRPYPRRRLSGPTAEGAHSGAGNHGLQTKIRPRRKAAPALPQRSSLGDPALPQRSSLEDPALPYPEINIVKSAGRVSFLHASMLGIQLRASTTYLESEPVHGVINGNTYGARLTARSPHAGIPLPCRGHRAR
jgi:hypothetical protein